MRNSVCCTYEMKIFFSYPHDANIKLVERIKSDLESRGHEIWFDKDGIKETDDWRSRITRAIIDSQAVVAFLSRHSVRDPGVCLNEIAIALGEKGDDAIVTVLVEPETEVSAPISITHIQWLRMEEWKEKSEDDGWYHTQLDKLIQVIENPRSASRNYELETLRLALDPLSFNATIAPHLSHFTGRCWLFERFNQWLESPSASRVFRIEGGPGLGKTAIASQLAHATKSSVLAVFLCQYNRSETREPLRLIQTLAYQLASRLPDYRARLLKAPVISRPELSEGKDAASLWASLIAEPLSGVGKEGLIGRQRLAIVIDGLDEATENGQNAVVKLLAEQIGSLPQWIGMVLTGRPDPEVVQRLSAYKPEVISGNDPQNMADLKAYIDNWLTEEVKTNRLGSHQVASTAAALLDKSEGAFLYLIHAREAVNKGALDITRPDDLPQGLNEIYLRFFERRFPDTELYQQRILPVIELMLAALEAMPEETAQSILEWKRREWDETIRELGSMFPRQGGRLGFFHKSLRDWLTDPEQAGQYRAYSEDGNDAITRSLWNQYRKHSATLDDYALANLPEHLHIAGCLEEYTQILTDFSFAMARCKAGNLNTFCRDYEQVEITARQSLGIWATFIRQKKHILRRAVKKWTADRILLQLAMEHAENSPLTQAAERWLELEKCDWIWIRRTMRPPNIPLDQCLITMVGHDDEVNGVMSLPDGRILSWSKDGSLRLWDEQTGECVVVFKGHNDDVWGAQVLADDRILSWSIDGTLRFWDGQTGECIAILKEHTGSVFGAKVLADGRILSWSNDGTLRFWDGQTGECIAILKGHKQPVLGAEVLSDGRILSWSMDETLQLWDGQTGGCIVVFGGDIDIVLDAQALSNGRIMSLSRGGRLRLWDEQTRECIVIPGQFMDAQTIPCGRILTRSVDNEMRLWDGQTGEFIAIFKGHTDSVFGVQELPDSRTAILKRYREKILGTQVIADGRVLAWFKDGTLRLWGAQTGGGIVIPEGHNEVVSGAQVVSNGRILSWSIDESLRLWDANSGECIANHKGIFVGWKGVQVQSDGRILSWADSRLWLWDGQTGECIAIFEGHTQAVRGAQALSSGRILSWSSDETLRLWDGQTGECVAILKHVYVEGARSLPDNRFLTWSGFGTLQLWDTITSECLAIFKGHDEEVSGANILPDGRILSWSMDGTLRIWNALSGECVAILEHVYVTGALSLPDNRILSWSRIRGILQLWDAETSECLAIFSGHDGDVLGVNILPDGRILSWSIGGTLRLWDGKTGKCLAVLAGHTKKVLGTKILPNDHILSWSEDHTLQLWNGKTGECCEFHDHSATQSTRIRPPSPRPSGH